MTAQIHEALILDGERVSMAYCPRLPKSHPRISAINPVEYRGLDNWMINSTACWRGYLGSWEIRDGRFYLTELRGRLALAGDEPLFAAWFSGTLRIPKGEELCYIHMGFGTVYEEELHIRIRQGFIKKSWVRDNRRRKLFPSLRGWLSLPGIGKWFTGRC